MPHRLFSGQPDGRDASTPLNLVLERERSAVGFGYLPGQNEPYSGPLRLRREERNEQIGAAGQPRAIVLDDNRDRAVLACPTDTDAARRFERSIDGVPYQVDQELI